VQEKGGIVVAARTTNRSLALLRGRRDPARPGSFGLTKLRRNRSSLSIFRNFNLVDSGIGGPSGYAVGTGVRVGPDLPHKRRSTARDERYQAMVWDDPTFLN
jgi:hypothetical protein